MATTETTETTGQGESAFPPLDSSTFPSQLLWLVIFFAALYFLLARMVLPRMASILAARKGQIDSDVARAQALKNETEAALKVYQKSLDDARGSAGNIAKTTRDDAAAHADLQQKSLNADLATKTRAAEDRIAAAKAKAMAQINTVAADSAVDIVVHLTGAKILKSAAAKAVAAVAK